MNISKTSIRKLVSNLKGFLKNPRVISITKLIITIILLVFYLASGDLNGLLGFLLSAI